MHYYLSKNCFMCLSNDKKLTKIISSDDVFAQIKLTFPEITDELSTIPLFICSTCQTALHFFHSYKIMCLNNYMKWKNYINVLKHDTVEDVNFSEFLIVIDKNELYLDVKNEEENDQEENLAMDTELTNEIKTETEDKTASNSEKMNLSELKKLYCKSCKKLFKLYTSKEKFESITNTPDVNCMFCNNNLTAMPIKILKMLEKNNIETNENKIKEITLDEILKRETKFKLLKVAKTKPIKTIEHKEETNENMIISETNENRDEICTNETEIKNFTNNMKRRLWKKIIKSIKPEPLQPDDTIQNKKAKQQLNSMLFPPRRNFLTYMSFNENQTSGQCRLCHKTFPMKYFQVFGRHIETHIRNSKYKCTKCKKPFIFKTSLQKHERIQHKNDFFFCEICGKKFSTHVGKTQHMLSHKNEMTD